MECSLHKIVTNYIVIPSGFTFNSNDRVRIATNSSLTCIEEPVEMKQKLHAHGCEIVTDVEILTLRWKGNVSYVVGVPILSTSNPKEGSFVSLVDTVYVDQVGALVGLDFEMPTNPDCTATARTTVHPTEVTRCYMVETKFSLPDVVRGERVQRVRANIQEIRDQNGEIRVAMERLKKDPVLINETKERPAPKRKNRGGRPRKMDAEKLEKAKSLREDSSYTLLQICNELDISKSTFYRYME